MLFLREPAVGRVTTATFTERARSYTAWLRSRFASDAARLLVVVPAAGDMALAGCDVVSVDRLLASGAGVGGYQAALCIDVLDRVADPAELLDALRARLRDGAVASFVHPAVDSRTARRAGTSWVGFRSGASRFFSVDTLQTLLVRHGFREPITLRDGAHGPDAALHSGELVVVSRAASSIGRHRLSVIVPVFNEHATFRAMMDQLIAKEIDGVDIEIIVIESNSTDGSRDEVKAFASHPRVKIALQERPRGKGNAVRTGLAMASGDIVLFQDADLEYEIEDYDDLLRPIMEGRSNFVIGSRHGLQRSVWKIREFNGAPVLSQVFNLGHVVFLGLLNAMYVQDMADPFSMFKVFRRDCIAGLRFECDRFDFDFEIVIKLLRKGYRPLEIPVNYHARSITEGKKVTMIRDPLTWLRALVRFRSSSLYG